MRKRDVSEHLCDEVEVNLSDIMIRHRSESFGQEMGLPQRRLLRNIIYDGIPWAGYPERSEAIVYTDDLVLLVMDRIRNGQTGMGSG